MPIVIPPWYQTIPPHGLDAVRHTYGDFKYAEMSGGNVRVIDGFERDNIITLHDVAGTGLGVQLHRKVAGLFELCFKEAVRRCPGYTVRMLGGYCPRHQSHIASNPLSIHSWGAAVDINWDTNPQGKPVRCDLPRPFISAFTEQGWLHGINFSIPDPQHFQLATGC